MVRAIETDAHVSAVRAAIARAQEGLVDRESIAEAVVLCAVAGEHLLVVGPPGTAKSEAVRRIADLLGGHYFEYLLGRFTEPNELFGPIDLRRLREGVVEVETAGMLPEAEVAFLDEVFLGSTAILNTLLGMLNERVFRRGRTAHAGARCASASAPATRCPTTRRWPRSPIASSAASSSTASPTRGWRSCSRSAGRRGRRRPSETARRWPPSTRSRRCARGCDLSAVQPVLGQAVRRLRSAGIELSDRRAVRSQRLIAAAAALDGRDRASGADLWVLPMIAPTADDQATAQEVLSDLIEQARARRWCTPPSSSRAAAAPARRA